MQKAHDKVSNVIENAIGMCVYRTIDLSDDDKLPTRSHEWIRIRLLINGIEFVFWLAKVLVDK